MRRRICGEELRRRLLNRVHFGLVANALAGGHQAYGERRPCYDEERASDPYRRAKKAALGFGACFRGGRIVDVTLIVRFAI